MPPIPYPAIPYAHTALQYTQGLFALTSATVTIALIKEAHPNILPATIEKAVEHIFICEQIFKKSRLSAGDKRQLEGWSQKLGPHIEMKEVPAKLRLAKISATAWCAAQLMTDASIRCPTCAKDKDWRGLTKTMDKIANTLLKRCPDADVAGTQIYMELAQ